MNILKEDYINISTEEFENIKCHILSTAGMVIVSCESCFAKPQIEIFEINEECVVMDFMYCNNVESCIDDLQYENHSKEKTHNIIYAPRFSRTFKIPAFQQVSYLYIILSKEFYYTLINENWALHENFSNKILIQKSAYLTSKYTAFSPAIYGILAEIKTCSRIGAFKKIFIETKIKELLLYQLESINFLSMYRQDIKEGDYLKLQKAKEIIEKDYLNPPNLKELSRIVLLNEFKFKKGFKSCFGTTVKSYIIKLRMEHAKELFKNKSISVTEVADRCGYKDVSHFSAAFKTFYGYSPQKFKSIR